MLYIVSTPIGNLEDITLRAIEILKSADVIACEDTRHTKILLDKYGIGEKHCKDINVVCHSDCRHASGKRRNPLTMRAENDCNYNKEKGFLDSSLREVARNDREGIPIKLISYHQHSGLVKTEKIISMLKEGKNVALVTDAGTPGISDPGSKLIAEAITSDIEVTAVPGPAAFVSALSVSGFDTSEFVYAGFLPHKKGRQTKLKEIAAEKRTIVLYESVHRIKKLLGELAEIIPDREVCVCRELTKKFEEIYRGTASEILDKIIEKGEFVVVIKETR